MDDFFNILLRLSGNDPYRGNDTYLEPAVTGGVICARLKLLFRAPAAAHKATRNVEFRDAESIHSLAWRPS